MPPLLHSAQLKPDVHITDLESTSDNEDEDDEARLPVPCRTAACTAATGKGGAGW